MNFRRITFVFCLHIYFVVFTICNFCSNSLDNCYWRSFREERIKIFMTLEVVILIKNSIKVFLFLKHKKISIYLFQILFSFITFKYFIEVLFIALSKVQPKWPWTNLQAVLSGRNQHWHWSPWPKSIMSTLLVRSPQIDSHFANFYFKPQAL